MFDMFSRSVTSLGKSYYSGGLFCFVFLAIEKNEGLLKL